MEQLGSFHNVKGLGDAQKTGGIGKHSGDGGQNVVREWRFGVTISGHDQIGPVLTATHSCVQNVRNKAVQADQRCQRHPRLIRVKDLAEEVVAQRRAQRRDDVHALPRRKLLRETFLLSVWVGELRGCCLGDPAVKCISHLEGWEGGSNVVGCEGDAEENVFQDSRRPRDVLGDGGDASQRRFGSTAQLTPGRPGCLVTGQQAGRRPPEPSQPVRVRRALTGCLKTAQVKQR